jgi:hypothetical protein
VPDLYRMDQPPRPGPELWIRRLRAGQSMTATILAASLYGLIVHWAGSKSAPCYKDKKKCDGCKRQLPQRWKGYLHAFDHDKREQCFVEVTPLTAESLASQVGTRGGYRGVRVRFERLNGDKARMRVTLLGTTDLGIEMPKERDPYETLAKLWGLPGGSEFDGDPTDVPVGQ